DRLPPAEDASEVDRELAAAEPTQRFKFLRFVRPWAKWLAFGFVLVAFDGVLSLLGPLFVKRGLDLGVNAGNPSVLWWSSAAFAVTVGIDWVVTWGYTFVTGRTAERALCALR